MTVPVRLTSHAYDNIVQRFGPNVDPWAWAERAFGIGVIMGETRWGRTVYETPDALLVVKFARGEPPTIITVMPSDWPIELVGREYRHRGDDVPATQGALRRLAERFRA